MDAFAFKFMDIKARHRVLYGKSPLESLQITREAALPRTPEEIIEIHYVVPLQVVLGFILGQILIWIFDYVGSDLRDYVRKKFKLDNSDIT